MMEMARIARVAIHWTIRRRIPRMVDGCRRRRRMQMMVFIGRVDRQRNWFVGIDFDIHLTSVNRRS